MFVNWCVFSLSVLMYRKGYCTTPGVGVGVGGGGGGGEGCLF